MTQTTATEYDYPHNPWIYDDYKRDVSLMQPIPDIYPYATPPRSADDYINDLITREKMEP